ncbi:MAG: hypothetical protein FWF20_00450 [Betaproteobacteria bacterium]|nr:hypothetical protein [Betaproteobacteria bacterium]MCL2885249.1 hypothetical protein [Betaproteobacteria bacterium]
MTPIIIRSSRLKLTLLLIGAIAFVALGIFMPNHEKPDETCNGAMGFTALNLNLSCVSADSQQRLELIHKTIAAYQNKRGWHQAIPQKER